MDILPADALGVTEKQLIALVMVYDLLKTGSLVHIKQSECKIKSQFKAMYRFNMSSWQQIVFQDKDGTDYCGSVVCIGGAAEAIGNVEFDEIDDSSGLGQLFYPCGLEVSLDDITSEQAKIALYNFLTTGRPKWVDVLSD
jgi:hypothetical protein